MLIGFLLALRAAGLRVGLGEWLALLGALDGGLAGTSMERFYHLARLALIKDEALFDRFDRAFAAYFQGVETLLETIDAEVPADWLRAESVRRMSQEERARIEALGGFEAILQALRERLREQREAHHGGNRWIGTGGTSPFGHSGYNPAGVRFGGGGGQGRALKVWERRDYRNLDDDQALGSRNLQVALRHLRRYAREGADEMLDLDGTIGATARNAGYLDLRWMPERRNAVRLLLLFDVGGSMTPHVRHCEALFSAARSEFHHLEYYYFHNCPYERLWRDNRRRDDSVAIWDVLHRYPPDWRLVLVGDATMSPYEISQPGGSVEHWNAESGAVWLERLFEHFHRRAWLNPEPQQHWVETPSIAMVRERIGAERMFPLTPAGVAAGMRLLAR
jgi:Uncharacterized protein conserved in bacteria